MSAKPTASRSVESQAALRPGPTETQNLKPPSAQRLPPSSSGAPDAHSALFSVLPASDLAATPPSVSWRPPALGPRALLPPNSPLRCPGCGWVQRGGKRGGSLLEAASRLLSAAPVSCARRGGGSRNEQTPAAGGRRGDGVLPAEVAARGRAGGAGMEFWAPVLGPGGPGFRKDALGLPHGPREPLAAARGGPWRGEERARPRVGTGVGPGRGGAGPERRGSPSPPLGGGGHSSCPWRGPQGLGSARKASGRLGRVARGAGAGRRGFGPRRLVSLLFISPGRASCAQLRMPVRFLRARRCVPVRKPPRRPQVG